VELHPGEARAAQRMHLTGDAIAAYLDRVGGQLLGRLIVAPSGEAVVEPDRLLRPEQVDPHLRPLERHLLPRDVQPELRRDQFVPEADPQQPVPVLPQQPCRQPSQEPHLPIGGVRRVSRAGAEHHRSPVGQRLLHQTPRVMVTDRHLKP
jgi:hypothetical protein